MNFDQNNLESAKSNYLLQHKENPIKWQSYTNEVLEHAKKENKPIFLSIGYSSCHWCHVMEKESFSNSEVADYLNKNFISIKLDREEFPDVDSYFQRYAQASNGVGGWPLNIFLDSTFSPFFAGTYFPAVSSESGPSFLELCNLVLSSIKDNIGDLEKNAKEVLKHIQSPIKAQNKVEFPGHFPAPTGVLNAIKEMQDNENGGYGTEAKFPQFSFYEYAVEQILEGVVEEEYANHILTSIEKMMMGSLYDHVKGGCHRYCTDKEWHIPHFEKMLYDQAGLLSLLSKTALVMPSPLIIDAQIQTLDYLQTEMLSEKGYFFSSQDSDSEGNEGLYFTYTQDEIKETLSANENTKDSVEDFLKWTRTSKSGNFKNGLNTISLNHAEREHFYSPENWNKYREGKAALLSERKMRIPPMTDSKGVASWNFQTLSALVNTLQYSKIDIVQRKASDLLKLLVEGMHKVFIDNGDNKIDKSIIKTSTINGHTSSLFEDYVFFTQAQFRVYEISGNDIFLQNGVETLKYIFKDFYKDSTFYTSSINEESLGIKNLEYPLFDQSYSSAYSLYILMIRKYSIHNKDIKEILSSLSETIENLTHITLTNPLSFGQALRALTYPIMAFKKIEVPLSWLREEKLQALLVNFSSRFLIIYHQREDEKWQICNDESCEMSGDSFSEFESIFKKK